ncbi:uncharacterized protein [Panulirus ornatus]|uniref:uncharacterized protein n=1 Tax=Panulirus ornatus TaxID=150431 RepID=UPI003A8A61D0
MKVSRYLRTVWVVMLLPLLHSGQLGSCLSLESRGVGGVAEQHRVSSMGRGYSSSSPSSSYNHQSPGQDPGRGNRHLQLRGIEVPVYKFRGEDAQLECLYDRGTDPLYSVKWYKDDMEFYRLQAGSELQKDYSHRFQTIKNPVEEMVST